MVRLHMLTGGYHSVRPTPKGELAGEAFFIGGNMLTQERLKELFNYDPDTGIFTRLVSAGIRKKGHVSNYTDKQGYIEIGIDGKVYLAHRLAWLYVYGEFPKEDIDHIDGVKNNNRISNLRDATNSENMQNKRNAQINNKTGFLGVSWHKKSKKYRAQIMLDKKCTSLGYFDSPEEAHEAYLKAKRTIHIGCTI